MTGFVQGVTGPLRAADLGVTHMHEHLVSDFRTYLPAEAGPEDDALLTEPLGLANRYELQTRVLNEHVLRVDRLEDALDEATAFRAAGGRTVVDATSHGIGRNPEALVTVAERTGLNVVMGSGWYVAGSMAPEVQERPVEALAEEIEHELTVGVGDTGIRAGIIGEVGLSWPHHPAEIRSLRAACLAQQRTGVALQIHPGRHPDSPGTAMQAVVEAGGNPERTIICHVERTLTSTAEMIALARTGCFLEFDLFGQESSYYFVPEFTGMPNDAGRVRHITELFEAGLADRILVSQDICTRVRLRRYGGEGMDHLLRRTVPLMRRMGLGAEEVDLLLVANPARALAGSISSNAPSDPPSGPPHPDSRRQQ